MSTTFRPIEPPQGLFTREQTDWIRQMQAQLFKAMNGAQPSLCLQFKQAEPAATAGEMVLGGSSWNAGLQYKSEDGSTWVYVGSTLPTLRLTSTSDASLTSTNHGLQIGPTTGSNLIMDVNEIISRNNGATDTLFLNAEGGDVRIGDATSTIRFGVRTASADAPINGYLTIQDAGGTTRKLAIIA